MIFETEENNDKISDSEEEKLVADSDSDPQEKKWYTVMDNLILNDYNNGAK